MTMHCTRCGAAIAAGERFCTACGAPVPAEAPAAEAPSPAPSEPAPPAAPAKRGGRMGGIVLVGVIFAGLLGVVLLALALLGNGASGGATAADWQTYVNARYGVAVDYPADVFVPEPPPDNNAGRAFRQADGDAYFFVFSQANALEQPVDALFDETVGDFGEAGPTYSRKADDWFVVAGIRDGVILYRRMQFTENASVMHFLEIGYPEARRAFFDPIVERMSPSFHVDPALVPDAGGDDAASAPGDAVATTGPAASGFRLIDSRDFGFALDGATSAVGFTAEVPTGWTRRGDGLPYEAVFTPADDVNGNRSALIFSVELANGRTPPEATGEHKAELESLGPVEVLTEKTGEIRSMPSSYVALSVEPAESGEGLVDELMVLGKDEQLYRIEFYAPLEDYLEARKLFERVMETVDLAD